MIKLLHTLCLSLALTGLSCQKSTQRSHTDSADASVERTISEAYRILLVGDIMCHGPQIQAALKADGRYDFRTSFDSLSPILRQADLTIGNLETTFGGKPYTGYPKFSSPNELGIALANVGFDILTTSNNHSADRSAIGIIRTLNFLDSLAIAHTGSGRDRIQRGNEIPLIYRLGNFTLAMLAYTYGTNGLPVPEPCWVDSIDTTLMAQDIRRADSLGADYKLVQIHWGTEYERLPNTKQKELAVWLHRHGVDAIIGSHPHVVQQSEWIQEAQMNKPTFVMYSMGNFISNQHSPIGARGGILLTLNLRLSRAGGIVSSEMIPSYQYIFVNKQTNTGSKIYRLLPIDINNGSIPYDDYLLPQNEQNELEAFCKYYKSVKLVKRFEQE